MPWCVRSTTCRERSACCLNGDDTSPTPSRPSSQFPPGKVRVVHAVQRCVRKAFLCGKDPLSGKSFEYRRMWIRQRLEFLASVFGIDCLTYTVLSNHLHLVLRSRPDVVAQWSDEKVARRWLRLFPQRQRVAGNRTRTGGRRGGLLLDLAVGRCRFV